MFVVEWIVTQFMKLAGGTALAGIAWVFLDGLMGYTIPFWIIWVVAVLLVYGVVFWLEHGDNHWDIL
ncbi:hypothetical protein PP460_gp134 [Streptomyces phage Muntaha]|uniref:Uncharacterized protein n=1 Tax=Streptomyces phage Muntaha TaxID=2713269 RepID=A0A6G8R3Y5_9CAUD|nr:hypothetical protein PP460_gp134 [Streptomyces phage Muntaha]QIN94668.1 hypothetical protein SEA_MUNTAHA_137 [Streptomyces phage Muntaha]